MAVPPGGPALQSLLTPYKRLLQSALLHPVIALVVAYGLLLASFGFVRFFSQQFFPPAERHQCLIDIDLPAGASVIETRAVSSRVAEILQSQPEVVNAVLYQGGTAPNFYYNVLPRQPAVNLAQVLINTRHAREVPALIVRLRQELDANISNAVCVVRQLDQGPAMEAPIMIRLTGPDLEVLRAKAALVADALHRAGGYKVSDDLGCQIPALHVDVQQDIANPLGISSLQVGRVFQSALIGFPVTELREKDRLIPVWLKMRPDEANDRQDLGEFPVRGAGGDPIPLRKIAMLVERPDYAVISRSGGQRAVTIKAYAPFGELASRILKQARNQIDNIDLPAGYALEYAGEARELKNSEREMRRVMLISLACIALAMVVQFNSVMKSLVVMLTVPLGLAGAFAGMAIMKASFGFMALLGIVSLAGVIVSHIIVLSDFIEEAREGGMELRRALLQAGLVRLRAVLATVLATVCGLVPLALQGGELWRPLTAVHIFGLLLATVLTLVVLPVWYYLLGAKLGWIKSAPISAPACSTNARHPAEAR